MDSFFKILNSHFIMKFLLFIFILNGLLRCTKGTDFLYENSSLTLSSVQDCDHYTKNGDCLVSKKEFFEIPSSIPLDIIFVLDVSQSMQPVLKKVAHGFNDLMGSINNFDWQMAFTTADHGDHIFYCEEDQTNDEGTDCLLGYEKSFLSPSRWQDYEGSLPYFGRFMPLQYGNQILDQTILSKNFPEPALIFQNTITHPNTENFEDIFCEHPPYCQGGNEQPLKVLKSIFSQAHLTHQNFFREGVGLVAFVVTNEPERVEDPQQATSAQEVLDEFNKAFAQQRGQKKFIVYSISIKDAECLNQQRAEVSASVDESKNLLKLVQKTDGRSEDLCLDDYSSAFSKISNHIHGRIQNVSLAHLPFIEEQEGIHIDIVITHPNGTKSRVLWKGRVRGKEIVFDREILPSSKIEIQYFHKKSS